MKICCWRHRKRDTFQIWLKEFDSGGCSHGTIKDQSPSQGALTPFALSKKTWQPGCSVKDSLTPEFRGPNNRASYPGRSPGSSSWLAVSMGLPRKRQNLPATLSVRCAPSKKKTTQICLKGKRLRKLKESKCNS